jgi:hypothetical protein
MLSSAEIARGSQGAVKFLSRDVNAPFHFDNTVEGCLRSFQVMILVAPIYAFVRIIEYMQINVAADVELIVLAEALRYLVEWLLYPVIFHEIARRRGWLDRYPRYIAALNWINLPQIVLLLVAEAVASLVPPVAAPLMLGLQVFFFYWFMMVTRLGLGASWTNAAVLMVVNWVPSYFLSILVNRFLGVSFGAS